MTDDKIDMNAVIASWIRYGSDENEDLDSGAGDKARRKITAYVAQHGLDSLDCPFNGYGDSGMVEASDVYTVRNETTDDGLQRPVMNHKDIPDDIVQLAVRYTEGLLSQRPGWEINDGATGSAVFKPDGSVYFDFEWRDSEATSPEPLVVSAAGVVSEPVFDELAVARRYEDSMSGLDVSSHLELQIKEPLTDPELQNLTHYLNEAYRRWQHSTGRPRG